LTELRRIATLDSDDAGSKQLTNARHIQGCMIEGRAEFPGDQPAITTGCRALVGAGEVFQPRSYCRFVAKSGASNRIGKLFVDYLRNGHGATTATAFSGRARPGLGVSMPVTWEDLSHAQEWLAMNHRDRVGAPVVSEG
jgi:hypothetical protein